MTDQTITQSRARYEHHIARKNLQEKYQAKLLFAHDGGMWKAGPELIVLLNSVTDESMVLLDEYQTPVVVTVSSLLEKATLHWQEQMNAWHVEYTEISRLR